MSEQTFYQFDAPREFLVLNAGDEPVEMTYDAEVMRIPACTEVHKLDSRGRESGKNSLGEYIPGSLVVRDIFERRGSPDDVYGRNPRGDRWSATEFVTHCLKIDPRNPKTYAGEGPFKRRGIALLPMNPAPDLVQTVRQQARESYVTFMEQWANDTLHTYAEKAAKWRSVGREDNMPGKDYHRALGIMKAAKDRLTQAQRDAGVAEEIVSDTTEAELAAFVRQAAEEAAYKLKQDKPELDMHAVVAAMMENPKFRQTLRESYNVNKKRRKAQTPQA